jgi:uncharacterized protein (TIGR03435 family)
MRCLTWNRGLIASALPFSMVALCAGVAFCQQQFEVASVKPSAAGQTTNSSGVNTSNGRVRIVNETLKRCITSAYNVGPNQVVGGPDWLATDRFDIEAKPEQPVKDDSVLMAMLQSLLTDRFKLVVHRETRSISAYVLETGKNGPKLEKSEGGGGSTSNSRGRIEAKNSNMDHFAEVLSRQMDLPVLNRTGLDGRFNLKLEWNPRITDPAAEGPSVFTAVQEQLGLRLRAQKTPVEMIVVEHADRPSQN